MVFLFVAFSMSAQKNFEGTITFKLSDLPSDFTNTVFYFGQNKVKTEIITPLNDSANVASAMIFVPDSNLIYQVNPYSKTAYKVTVDTLIKTGTVFQKTGLTKTIAGHLCYAVEVLVSKMEVDGDSISTNKEKFIIWYAKDLHFINSDQLSQEYEILVYDGSISLEIQQYSRGMPNDTMTIYTAIKVEPGTLSPDEFRPPSNFTIAEMKVSELMNGTGTEVTIEDIMVEESIAEPPPPPPPPLYPPPGVEMKPLKNFEGVIAYHLFPNPTNFPRATFYFGHNMIKTEFVTGTEDSLTVIPSTILIPDSNYLYQLHTDDYIAYKLVNDESRQTNIHFRETTLTKTIAGHRCFAVEITLRDPNNSNDPTISSTKKFLTWYASDLEFYTKNKVSQEHEMFIFKNKIALEQQEINTSQNDTSTLFTAFSVYPQRMTVSEFKLPPGYTIKEVKTPAQLKPQVKVEMLNQEGVKKEPPPPPPPAKKNPKKKNQQ